MGWSSNLGVCRDPDNISPQKHLLYFEMSQRGSETLLHLSESTFSLDLNQNVYTYLISLYCHDPSRLIWISIHYHCSTITSFNQPTSKVAQTTWCCRISTHCITANINYINFVTNHYLNYPLLLTRTVCFQTNGFQNILEIYLVLPHIPSSSTALV
jgi:hypothetical protein